MKNKSLFWIFIIIANCSLLIAHCEAQDWKWLTPTPADNSWGSVCFPTARVGYAVGTSGMIIKTSDGGENWTLQKSGTCEDLYSVSFTNEKTGYAVGVSTIIQTEDGGKSWIIKSDTIKDLLISVCFPSPEIGYVFGESTGMVLKTTDSGRNWLIMGYFDEIIYSACFLNTKKGYVVGCNGSIFQTLDGGINWKFINNPATGSDQVDFNSIYFPDSTTGYALAYATDSASSILMKSADGGNNWVIQHYTSDGSPLQYEHNIYFSDSLKGYAYGYGISKTNDGGKTWSFISNSPGSINCIYFTTKDTVMAVGNNSIYMSLNGCYSWKSQKRYLIKESNIRSVYFIDSLCGYIGGDDNNIAFMYKTKDGGKSWIKQILPKNHTLSGISYINFIDTLIGYAIEGYGKKTIIKTFDGGKNWFYPDTLYNHSSIQSVQFVNSEIGFLLEQFGKILKTTDGAKTWKIIYNNYELISMHFVDTNIGYVIGSAYDLQSDIILKTTDGGDAWIKDEKITKFGLSSIFFLNKDTGFASGATFIKTTNGGKQWDSINSVQGDNLYFINSEIGYMLGSKIIYRTLDGGLNWISSCVLPVTSLCFPTANIGYAVGGGMLKTTNGGGIITKTNELRIEKGELRIKVYPNPLQEQSVVSYNVSSRNPVIIKVYDFTGREVLTLINKMQDKGDYQIIINSNNLKNGMYLIKIETNNNVNVLKCIKCN